VEGWTILSDPTFDPPGRTYGFGWGTSSRKVAGPAIALPDLPPVDVVLLSHDNHADNLDDAGRAMLPSAGTVVTTPLAARRLAVEATGLEPWSTTRVTSPGRPDLVITATPCRHGPPLSRPIVGHVAGFALRWEGQADGVTWISGDTVLYDGVREVAGRLDVDVAVLHLGEVKFGITGPVRYSMTAEEAIELTALVEPRVAIPVHFEGWTHFREGRDAIEHALAGAPPGVRSRFRFIELGVPADLTR
jgi:L-ascorbate metabolism protein UlaG (beta-lactamase superfamily)